MNTTPVRAYVVRRDAGGQVSSELDAVPREALPEGDLTVRVHWSSMNYKDALAATGHPGVAPKLPHVPGIDAAGVVVECPGGQFAPGQSVIVTGYELGAPRWGGWAELIRVPPEWAVPLPPTLTEREAMIYGTAGFTAAQSVMALQRHGITSDAGEVVVTGASGGVGSVAVGILAKLGYRAVAASGKGAEILKQLGAARIIGRADVDDRSGKPLLAAKWAAAVDGVGGNTLATLLRTTSHRGCVAAYGLVGGADLAVSLYPFLLRGVALYGIDSAQCPLPERREVWHRLAGPWKLPQLAALADEITPEQLGPYVRKMLNGETVGRVVVRWM
jgi:putative YhdH/YhfP family quinone oxidoreductase